ncbi:MAG: glutathione S-transferase domain-containing protein, partial [Polyangiaceae bacterium]|nr:glutathione S-transferase domain-containing protein [Polyangiaceae bacterium]
MPRDLPLRPGGRSGSHFTRVARIGHPRWACPSQLEVVHDLGWASTPPPPTASHPGLKLPTLQLAEGVLFGTDNICRALAE